MFIIRMMNSDLMNKYVSWSPFRYEIDCILACAEHGNITKAAERVGLTQASLSKVLQKTESSLGLKVFVRSPRGIKLTASGKEFVQSLKNIRNHWTQFAQDNPQDEEYGLSEISVGTHSSIAGSYFPKILEKMFLQYPRTNFKFDFSRSVEVTQKVARSELDIGLVVNPVRNPELIAKKFSYGYLALWGKDKTPSQDVLYSSDMFLGEKILRVIKNKRLIEMNDYYVIANTIKNSSITGLLPRQVGEIFGLHMQSNRFLVVDMTLIYRKDRFHSPHQKAFIAKVSQLLMTYKDS